MSTILIMAGGKSTRMRNSTLKDTHKAQETVFGTSLLELNILYAYIHGYTQISISVSSAEPDLIAFINELKSKYKSKIFFRLIVETTPLGTIGAAQLMESTDEDLVVLNVDNLISLDLNQFLKSHQNANAAMTIASHMEPFKMPFGQLVTEDTRVVNYLEKPIIDVLISSGTYIISSTTQEMIIRNCQNKRLDIPELALQLINEGKVVHSYKHTAFWTDINDKETLTKIRATEKWPILKQITALQDELLHL